MKDIIGLAVLSWPLMLLIVIGLAFLMAIPLAVRYAKRTGSSKWRWGVGAFLLVFLPIFWDWIPTVAMHQYYCAKDSGFWVYKTLDQWKAENPGVMEGLVANRGVSHSSQGDSDSYIDTFPINQRFNLIAKNQGPFFLHRWRREDELVDTKTNETLARYVDFSTSQYRRQAVWSGWKFWLDSEQCIGGLDKAIESGNFMNQFRGSEK